MIPIVCLPIAGTGNPYQKLMMEGLAAAGMQVSHGVPGKLLVFVRSAIRYRPAYIHIDWLHSYYLRRRHWMTWLLYPLFVLDVLIAKYILGVKFVWTLHNIFPHDRPVFGPYLWARQFFARQCDWIRVFDSGTVQRASEALGIMPEKFRIVPEGSYIGYYPNTISKEDAKRQLGLPDSKRILLYLGLIKPYKGVLELVKSYEACPEKHQAILLIAGKAMNAAYLRQVQEAIQTESIYLYNRFVADDELQVFFNAADVMVLPFERIENSGSAILAMGFAKPIIAPARGVLTKRLFQQPELLYKDQSIPASILDKAILLTDQEIESIGDKNFQALKQFKWEDFASYFN